MLLYAHVHSSAYMVRAWTVDSLRWESLEEPHRRDTRSGWEGDAIRTGAGGETSSPV